MKYKKAFTLAEVLITLGIIGIVAAMTLPALITKYEKKKYAAQVKETYSIVSNALVRSVADNGAPNEWEYSSFKANDPDYTDKTSEHLKLIATKYFKPYFQTIDEGKSSFGYYLTLKNGITLYFYPDGYYSDNSEDKEFIQNSIYIIGSLNNNYSHFLDSSRDYSKKDFIMMVDRKTSDARLRFSGDRNGIDDIKNNSKYGCNKSIIKNYRIRCGALLQYNNWEITDDYPW